MLSYVDFGEPLCDFISVLLLHFIFFLFLFYFFLDFQGSSLCSLPRAWQFLLFSTSTPFLSACFFCCFYN